MTRPPLLDPRSHPVRSVLLLAAAAAVAVGGAVHLASPGGGGSARPAAATTGLAAAGETGRSVATPATTSAGTASRESAAVARSATRAAVAPSPSLKRRVVPGPVRSASVTTSQTQKQAVTPKPTSAASCTGTKVWTSLAACSWPGPGNTGYPAGRTLKASGALVVTKAGTVIDGLKVTGGIQVRAKNVVIRNSLVTMSAGGRSGTGVININPGASATIEHTTIDGQNATHTCIWHEGVSMKAVANNCSRVNDGIFMWATTEGVDGSGDYFTIQDNWLHGFTTAAANGHVDAIQTEGAKHGTIRHNTIDVSQSQTSAIALWNSRKSTTDVLVDHNLIAGGGFSVYAEDYSPSEANPKGGYSVTNVRFTNNVFSTVRYGCVGYWGVWFPRGAPTDGWTRSGNIVWETKAKVDGGNPTSKGAPCN